MIKPPFIHKPLKNERPTYYADRIGERYVAQKSDEHRRGHGLYLTPPLVADFMAEHIQVTGKKLFVLDPAAGCGVLSCAAIEALASRPDRPELICLVAYEVDIQITPILRIVLSYLVDWCYNKYGVEIVITIEPRDFILAHRNAQHFADGSTSLQSDEQYFDIIISNPPYFKISKDDPRATAMTGVVNGQPNIYGIFMAISATLLKVNGDFIFIVSRSFTSGRYFRQLRSVLFRMVRPAAVHVFGSRREAFRRDEVLQENIIFYGTRDDHWHQKKRKTLLKLSSSHGISDIKHLSPRVLPMEISLNMSSLDKFLRLSHSDEDDAVLSLVDSWPCTLQSLGLNISTGPVVPFRAANLICNEGNVPWTHVHLLWMNHVRAFDVTWPLNLHKPEFIKRKGAEALLVPNKNYVILRRFSAKEESRRLTAAPYIASNFDMSEVGLENHLNYIYRPNGALTEEEVWGLASLYNSRLLDTFFRAVNGNTQVSATELRAIPLPSHDAIIAIGQLIKKRPDPLKGLDELVIKLVTNYSSLDTAANESIRGYITQSHVVEASS